MLVLFCGCLFIMFLYTSRFRSVNYYHRTNSDKEAIITERNTFINCAESILDWCLVNHIDQSNCSWTIGTFHNHFYSMASIISKPIDQSAALDTGVAFVRLGDGELMLMFGISVNYIPADHWSWPGGQSRLGQDLKDLLRYPKQLNNLRSPFYYGIYDVKNICPFHELLVMINQHPKFLTYANLFVNSNYPATKVFQKSLIADEHKRIILIINNRTTSTKLAELNKWAEEILQYPDNGPVMWQNSELRKQAIEKILLLAKRYKNRLFAFAVGPLSKVLIHYAWIQNPYNRYIDFGSTLDEITKNKVTRPYQTNTELYKDPTYLVKFNINTKKFDITTVD